jgi:aconitate hydratase
MAPATLAIRPGDRIEIDALGDTLQVRAQVPVRIVRADHSVQAFTATAAVETGLEVELLRVGGVIPSILKQALA